MLIGEQLAALKKPKPVEELSPAVAEMARRTDMLFRLKSLGPAFSRKLTKKGTYKIICTIHLPKMAMTLIVR